MISRDYLKLGKYFNIGSDDIVLKGYKNIAFITLLALSDLFKFF